MIIMKSGPLSEIWILPKIEFWTLEMSKFSYIASGGFRRLLDPIRAGPIGAGSGGHAPLPLSHKKNFSEVGIWPPNVFVRRYIQLLQFANIYQISIKAYFLVSNIGVWDVGRGQLPPSFEKSTIFRAAAVFFGQRSQNKECLNATCKAWEVPFPAIWEVFLAKIFLLRYAPTDGGAPLRLYHDG